MTPNVTQTIGRKFHTNQLDSENDKCDGSNLQVRLSSFFRSTVSF